MRQNFLVCCRVVVELGDGLKMQDLENGKQTQDRRNAGPHYSQLSHTSSFPSVLSSVIFCIIYIRLSIVVCGTASAKNLKILRERVIFTTIRRLSNALSVPLV